ncbi:MAG: ABC transporter ATP-binding protein [Candidatus Methanomethylicaceae archaeon]
MARVKLENLTKRFGNVIAVNRVNLEIKDGEFICLLGPSGCGKTTTLRMIAGVEKPDEGNIYIDDVLVNDLPPKDRDIAMVFQFYVMYPSMKVFDQIAFPLKIRGVPKDEIKRRVKEVASLLGIENILNEPVDRLTAGEKQRIELGRAIIRSPKVYLLDEPLTNLDAKTRASMRTELKHLMKTLKTTTIYVTHDQIEAMSMADRIAIMNFGNLLQCDTPDVVYNNPKNLFVAGFIGSPTMNFIDCTVIEKNGKVFLDANDFLYDISEYKELIREFIGSEVILGIRPEHISISKTKQSEDSIEAKVSLIEPISHRILFHLTLGEHSITVNTYPIEIDVNQKVWIVFNKNKIHIFDKKTEEAII